MKKELIVCDVCCKDATDVEEFVEATEKCKFCGKDVCDDCYADITIGDESGDINILSVNCCDDCAEETKLNGKEDKKVVKEVKKILLNHFKKKVLAKNLK